MVVDIRPAWEVYDSFSSGRHLTELGEGAWTLPRTSAGVSERPLMA